MLLTGCASGTLPDYNVLGGLRVLAMIADTPEVDPTGGPTVHITPVVSDLNLGRTLSWAATGCIDPGVGYGAPPSCANVPGATSLGSGAVGPLDAAKHTTTGAAPPVTVTIPPTILTGHTPVDQYNGVAYLVVYTLTATDSAGATQTVTAFKRIIASTPSKTPKNTNPTLSDVTTGSQSLSAYLSALAFPVAAGTSAVLGPAFGAGSAESYSQMNSDQTLSPVTEQLTTTWFISDGSITFYRTQNTDTNTWQPPQTQPTTSAGQARSVVLVVVTRDGRGGEAYLQLEN
jgi:hypothetical protein